MERGGSPPLAGLVPTPADLLGANGSADPRAAPAEAFTLGCVVELRREQVRAPHKTSLFEPERRRQVAQRIKPPGHLGVAPVTVEQYRPHPDRERPLDVLVERVSDH